ncbi:oxidoreductase, aldo/keto reductase [Nitzschia inconspicua]|uniref:Oxidoreductase, aldo/keto reductase n=1 Tax=Nitzschia inconspicua TaxID=303405 RepID=A0A9K3PXB6_9STRA|nr:oxidoreductase, aldo/keto reductase [Nitzschia inconspicua]
MSSSSSSSINLRGINLGAGLMQWGTTHIDNSVVNPKGNLSDDTVRDIWKTCRQNGVLFFDTAEGYGGGTSEVRIRQVREWYQDKCLDGQADEKDVIVATKYLPTLWRWTKWSFYGAVRGSMQRLGVDKIDLYFIHTPIHPLPIECFVQWACDAVHDGLVQAIGISNCDASLVRRAEAVAQRNGLHIACNQIMLNLLVWQSQQHQETVRTCQELGITIAAYSPIGQGLLTDSLTPEKFQSIRAVKMTGVKYDELMPLRSQIQSLCEKYHCSMAQVAINWVRGHGAIPLIGCRSVEQVLDATNSQSFQLTNDEVASLDGLSLGLSLFNRPLYRRSLFVVFISILQLAYSTEQWIVRIASFWKRAFSFRNKVASVPN